MWPIQPVLTPGFNTRGPAGGASWVGRGIIVSLRTVADRESRRPLELKLELSWVWSSWLVGAPPNLPKSTQRERSKERNADANQQVKVKSSQVKSGRKRLSSRVTSIVSSRQGAHSAVVSSGEVGSCAVFCRIRP